MPRRLIVWFVLVLGGCPEDDPGTAPETGVPAPPPEPGPPPEPEPEPAPSTQVDVMVYQRIGGGPGAQAVPAPGAAVYSADADGRFANATRTDDDGRTSVDVPAGGAVTVEVPDDEGEVRWFQTVFAVPADASLVFGEAPFSRPSVAQGITVDLDLRPNPAPEAPIYYGVRASCGIGFNGAGVPEDQVLEVDDDCAGEAIRLVAVNHRDSAFNAPVAFAVTEVEPSGWPPSATAVLDDWSIDPGALAVDVPDVPGEISFYGGFGVVGRGYVSLGTATDMDENPVDGSLPSISAFDHILLASRASGAERYEVVAAPDDGDVATVVLDPSDYLPPVEVTVAGVESGFPTVLTSYVGTETCGEATPMAVYGSARIRVEASAEEPSEVRWSFLAPAGVDTTVPELSEEGEGLPLGDRAVQSADGEARIVAATELAYATLVAEPGATAPYEPEFASITGVVCRANAGS